MPVRPINQVENDLKLSPHVEAVKNIFLENPQDYRNEIALKLFINDNAAYSPDIQKMWQSLERARHSEQAKQYWDSNDPDNDMWVYEFCNSAYRAACLPPYFYKSKSERLEIRQQIQSACKKLRGIINGNQLGYRLDSKSYPENHAAYIMHSDESYSLEQLVDMIENSSITCLQEADRSQTNKTQRVKQNRFVRSLALRNEEVFGKHLLSVVSTATFLIYGGRKLEECDVLNLLKR